MNEQCLQELAIHSGAKKAAFIDAKRIVLSSEFRDICKQNGCGNYHRCYMCPPDIGDIEVLMQKVRSFSRAMLYQTIGTLEDSFDIEGMTAAAMEHAQVSQRIQRGMPALWTGTFLHLTCGGCRLCEVCAQRTGEPCRHPGLPLPSLESYGVDVYQTTKDTELKYINGQNTVTFFGMVLWGA